MKSRIHSLLIIKNRKNRRSLPTLKQQQSFTNIGLVIIMVFLIILTGIPIIGGYLFIQLSQELPSTDWLPAYLDPQKGILLEPTTLYDQSGEMEIFSLQEPGINRRFLSIDPNQPEFISPYVVQVVVSYYQPDFWTSPGYSKNIFSSNSERTIAERVVERLLLWDEQPGFQRDLRMRLLASQITKKFGRAQILEWFLNSTAYGHQTIGIESASQLYLNKGASQLNLAEATLLTATALTPSLNPLDAPQTAIENQKNLLNHLYESGFIAEEDFNVATKTDFNLVTEIQPIKPIAAAFSSMVLEELYQKYSLDRVELGGFRITTSLNTTIQQSLACTIESQIFRIYGSSTTNEECEPERLLPSIFDEPIQETTILGSAVILDPATGEIVALVGDHDAINESSMVTTKQGGTILSPLIAVNAFVRGFSPATQVWDIPNNIPVALSQYKLPLENYKGPIRFRTAIANNYYAGITKLFDQVGYDVVTRSANSFGLETLSKLENSQEILFSGKNTSITEIANFYSIFSNLGIQTGIKNPENGLIEPKLIRKIEFSDGLPIEELYSESQVLLTSQLAYLVHDILQDDYERRQTLGYPNPLEIGRPSAAKYGTTFSKDEIWTAGYTPQFVTVVWFGQKGEQTIRLNESITGGVWYAMMQWLHQDLPVTNWQIPIGLSEVTVCSLSGLLPTQECPSTIPEIFIDGTLPSGLDNLFRNFEINRETGLLATVYTPSELIDSRTFMLVPEEAQEWAQFNNIEVPPTNYDLIQAPRPNQDLIINSPENFSYVKGTVEIFATVLLDDIANYRLQIGQGLNPQNWLQIGEELTQRITNRKVIEWDSTSMDDGLYALRLLVIKENQEIDTHTIQISIDNTLPLGRIIYPFGDQTVISSSQSTITLQADVSDNIGIDFVEWWIDGQMIGKISETPYSYPISITSGEHTLSMQVYDTAGNSFQTEEIIFFVQ